MAKTISAVKLTPWISPQKIIVDFQPESPVISTVSMVPGRSPSPSDMSSPQCQWHRGDLYSTSDILNQLYELITLTTLIQKNWGFHSPDFLSPQCHWHRGDQMCRLSKRISRRIRSHMRNGFKTLVRALGGFDWWKNRRSKTSWQGPFKKVF
jgi:hypothetical protein